MRYSRRAFLAQSAALLALARPAEAPTVMTVAGPVAAADLGPMLPHEHLFSTFGAAPTAHPDYDAAALTAAVGPYLRRLHGLGCRAIADCTAQYFGRDPLRLRALSEASGVRVLTNTGYYGAAEDRYVPAHAFAEDADALARRWTREFTHGIGETGIRPGFIKIGVDAGPLSAIDRKLVAAAARTHAATGLVIASHTGGSAAAAFEQLDVLRAEGVAAEAWIWVHAHAADDPAALLRAAEQGAWISLDGLSPASAAAHLARLEALRAAERLGQVLLSHDGNSFRAGGRPPKPYEALWTHFLPMLSEAGFTPAEQSALVEQNPARAFALRARLR